MGSDLKSIEDLLGQLLELANADDGTVGPALGSREDWTDLSTRAQKISSLITVSEPPEEIPVPGNVSDGDDAYDEEGYEDQFSDKQDDEEQ